MTVITCPEKYIRDNNDIVCFLAGGITDCWDWQTEVINELKKYENTEHLIIFNPRRESFPINDPNASFEQIKWEFKWLESCDIFSMYFVDSPSVQPICMYELGRNVSSMEWMYGCDEIPDHLVISSEKGYKRLTDVVMQMNLACYRDDIVYVYDDPKEAVKNHARRIVETYRKL